MRNLCLPSIVLRGFADPDWLAAFGVFVAAGGVVDLVLVDEVDSVGGGGGLEVVVGPSSRREALFEKDREKCAVVCTNRRSCRRDCTRGLATL